MSPEVLPFAASLVRFGNSPSSSRALVLAPCRRAPSPRMVLRRCCPRAAQGGMQGSAVSFRKPAILDCRNFCRKHTRTCGISLNLLRLHFPRRLHVAAGRRSFPCPTEGERQAATCAYRESTEHHVLIFVVDWTGFIVDVSKLPRFEVLVLDTQLGLDPRLDLAHRLLLPHNQQERVPEQDGLHQRRPGQPRTAPMTSPKRERHKDNT